MLDHLIVGGTVVDGTGRGGAPANVGIRDGKIAFVGSDTPDAGNTIDGSGKVVCPGFVDVHSHIDYTYLDAPGSDNFLLQGITTSMGGHCGMTLAPDDRPDDDPLYSCNTFSGFLDRVRSGGIGANYVPQAGYGPIRRLCMGGDCARPATADEVARMTAALRECFEAGAAGFSASYDAATPTHFATREEILELLRVVREYDRLYTPHTIHHQNQWPSDRPDHTAYGLYVGPPGEILTGRYHGLVDAIEQARETPGLRMMISHLTVGTHVPQPHPAYVDRALARAALEELIDLPRMEGMDVVFNAIPCDYSVGSTMPLLDSFFNPLLSVPAWLGDLSRENFVAGLADPFFRRRVAEVVQGGGFKFGMVTPATDPYWGCCFRIASCADQTMIGRTVHDLALARSPNHRFRALYFHACDVLFDILAADPGATWTFVLDKREAGTWEELLLSPFGHPCTDSNSFSAASATGSGFFGQGLSPASFNIFAHYLDTMVRRQRRLSLPACIRKLTGFAAAALGLPDRGILREGNWADVLVLDLAALAPNHDFATPNRGPAGIDHVFVNGTAAVRDGRLTGVRAGRILARKS